MSLTLPTTFTPPSSCLASTNIWAITTATFCATSTLCPYYLMQGPPTTDSCLPPSYGGEFSFYLPGECPSGYTSACTSVKSLGAYTVTVSICCPAGGFQCQSNPSLEWQTTLGCFTPFTRTETLTVIGSQTGTTSINTVTVSSQDAANAYAIAIQIPGPTTKDISNTGSSTINPTISATTGANSSNSSPSAETQSSGLSTAAKAGIGIGVVLGIAIIFLFGFFWGKVRRRTSDPVYLPKAHLPIARPPTDSVSAPPMVESAPYSNGGEIHEMQGYSPLR